MRADDHISRTINGIFHKLKIKNCFIAVEEAEDIIYAWPLHHGEKHETYQSAMYIFEQMMLDLDGRMVIPNEDRYYPDPFAIGVPLDVTTKEINRASKYLMKSYDDHLANLRKERIEEKRVERGEEVISRFNL